MNITARYAHCAGHTDLTFDESGKYIVTCGSDGDLRIFDGFEDDEPKTHHLGGTITAMAFKNEHLYIATDANAVMVYTFPEVVPDGLILQFFSSVYYIACSSSGKFVAAGGGDFMIKVYNTETKKLSTCSIHDAPVLSLAFDPEEKYLASSSCDGTIRISDLSDYSCIKTLSLMKKSNDLCNSETFCRLQWLPVTGKFLAIPVERELRFYERDTWNLSFILQDNNAEILSLSAFSPCGSFVVSASNEGLIQIWNIKTKKSLGKNNTLQKAKICNLKWNPSGKNEVAFCDVEGQFGMLDNFVLDCPSQEAKVLPIAGASFIPDEDFSEPMITDSDFKNDGALREVNANDGALLETNTNDGALDIGAMKAEWEPKIFGSVGEDEAVISAENAPAQAKSNEVVVPTTPIQIPFQPSSTPLHLDNRFMLWNTIGIVRCYNTEEENSIDVEFHDASIYHPVHVNNVHNFTMASLSSEALLLASSITSESPSKLQCLHIGTWDANKEWTVDMGEEEEVEAICLGRGWAAAATSARLLRLFVTSGIQCEVFCIPGPVVCLASAEENLAIAYHRGPGLVGEQNLGVMLVKVGLKSNSVCKDFPLPITAKSFLSWMGYSDEGQLCAVDTSGIVRILSATGLVKWIPIANTKSNVKGKSDNYFVVGLSELQQEIRCIPCKGSRYPAMLPRPTVVGLSFNLSFCETSSDKGRLEEEQGRLVMLRNRIKSLIANEFDLDSELSTVEKNWTDTLLKMFALAIKTEREYRAMDVAELMPNARIVQGAIKYATQKHRMALAEKLGSVAHKKAMEEAVEIQNAVGFDEDEDFAMQPVQSYSSSVLSRSKVEESEMLRPKPLKRSSARENDVPVATNDRDSDVEETEHNDDSVLLLPRSSPMVNPFKLQPKNVTKENKENNLGIDQVLSESARKLSSKEFSSAKNTEKKISKQAKLFSKKNESEPAEVVKTAITPKKFGFPLFLEENIAKLQEEHPDKTEWDIAKIAIKLFKELPADEKEKYKSKPVQMPASIPSNKRKVEDETQEENPSDKKSKKNDSSSGAANNFSMFAFVKKNKS